MLFLEDFYENYGGLNNMKKTLIFDLDGTIYNFEKNSFVETRMYSEIKKNSIQLIQRLFNKNENDAIRIFNSITEKYGTEISVGFEKELGVNRLLYFKKTCNIKPEKYIEKDHRIFELLKQLKRRYNLVLLTDAPLIWAKKVLIYFRIYNLFKGNIFTGETNTRKSNYNALENVCLKKRLNPENCISIGDQENTDITPAKRLGMKTIFVGYKESRYADYSIKSILEIKNILEV